MCGMLAAWNTTVTQDEAGLRVNLLFSRNTAELDVRSYIPVEGRVELNVKQASDVYVRIPSCVKLDKLSATVDGKEVPKRMYGPYLLIPNRTSTARVEITFPQTVSLREETLGGVTYREEWVGDTVWNITPAGERVPIYTPSRLALYGVAPDARIE